MSIPYGDKSCLRFIYIESVGSAPGNQEPGGDIAMPYNPAIGENPAEFCWIKGDSRKKKDVTQRNKMDMTQWPLDNQICG